VVFSAGCPKTRIASNIRHTTGPIMKALHILFRLGLLIGIAVEFPGWPALAQTTSSKETQPAAPGLRRLTGDDAKRAQELRAPKRTLGIGVL
jgi:hypothetical protein